MALQTTKPSLAHALVCLWDQSEAFSAIVSMEQREKLPFLLLQ